MRMVMGGLVKVFAALLAEGMRLEEVTALTAEVSRDEADIDVEDAPSLVLGFLILRS